MIDAVRAHIIVTGIVQGVYYRVTARQEARLLGLTGWVKNRRDGSVEAVVEGTRDKVLEFIDWSRQGPPASQVSDVQVLWEDFRGEYQEFSIVN